MRLMTFCFFKLFLLMSLSLSTHANEKNAKLISAMQSDGHILMIRHAMAPGFGDPDNIKIGDCSTQRNLDESGRKQSKNIGEWLKSHDIKPSAIYSSQWCRCLETSELLGLGKVKELPALNSFFQMTENREPNLRALKQFISEQNIADDLIIMVTHSVTISAMSGQNVASGDGVLLKLNKDSSYDFINVVSANLAN